jgi:hypothetical protein
MQGKEIRELIVYWGPREESARDCAARLRAYWDMLHDAFPLIEHWFDTGKTRKEAWISECISARSDDGLERFLLSGVNRRDFGGEIIPSLGFTVSVWNQRKRPAEMGMSLSCGMFHQQMINNLGLSFPEDPKSIGIDTDDDILKLLEIGGKNWDAEYGRIYAVREPKPFFEYRF